MRTTWRHIRANPVDAIVMWLVNFVVFAVVNGAVRAVLGEPLTVGALLLWSTWLATLQTFTLTWFTQRQRQKAAAASGE